MSTVAPVIKAEVKEWTPRNGGVRFYVNNWKEIIDLSVDYYNTGNVKTVAWGGTIMSNSWYNKKAANIKVWFDAQGKIHVDHCYDDALKAEIVEKVTASYGVF